MLRQKLDDFKIGAPVHSSEGRHIGKLHRLVLDRESFHLRALVVQESLAFAGKLLAPGALLLVNDVVVPPEAVDLATHDRIDLNIGSAEVRLLPPYLSYRYQPADGAAAEVGSSLLSALEALGGAATVPANLEEVAAKTDFEIEINPGEEVVAPGGRLGEVEDILIVEGELVGVVLRPGGLFKRRVVVPRRLLSRGDNLRLEADLATADLDRLEPFEPESTT